MLLVLNNLLTSSSDRCSTHTLLWISLRLPLRPKHNSITLIKGHRNKVIAKVLDRTQPGNVQLMKVLCVTG